jgi:hypothetical protein
MRIGSWFEGRFGSPMGAPGPLTSLACWRKTFWRSSGGSGPVAEGSVSPREWDYYNSADRIHPVLDFLEPNLAFRLAERSDSRRVIEVAFYLESHPERSDDERLYLRLDVSIQDVERAANEWHQAFPPR